MSLQTPVFKGDTTSPLPSAESSFPPERILRVGTGFSGRILRIATNFSGALSGRGGLPPIFDQQTSDGRMVNQETADDEALAYQKYLESSGAAVTEVRRLTGLTWEKLTEIFGVSRRSLHFWASGEKLNEKNEERVHRIREAIQKIDRGTSVENRALLLREHDGIDPIELLKEGDYEAFVKTVGVGPGRRRRKLRPLSRKEQEARMPLPIEVLVNQRHDSVHIERRGRVVVTPLPYKTKK